MEDQVAKKSFKSSFFPESIDKIPLCKADKSIPAVESVALDERALHELDDLSHLMDEQAHLEQSSTQLSNHSEKHELDSTSPEPCQVKYIFFVQQLMPCPSMGPKLFWTVQIILDGSNLFWLCPNTGSIIRF